VHTLVKYFSEYKKRVSTDLKLLLIGGGQMEIPSDYQTDILDLGFLPIQDKYDAYAASTFLCQPSTVESFSLVIMESWLCYRPVLVHRDCEVTRYFAEISNGGLYFKNYFEFEGCVRYLCGHEEEADQMGKNGREFAVKNFSWDVIVEKYRRYFEQI